MNILWIVNKPLIEAVTAIGGNFAGKVTESWVTALADTLVGIKNIKLSVASIYGGINKLQIIQGEKVTHYLIPEESGYYKYHREYEIWWPEIKEKVQPDVVHIHGTERPLGLSYVKVCGARNVVASLQGIVTEIEKYYYAGFPSTAQFRNATIHDILMANLPFQERKHFHIASQFEKELLQSINFVIGRTTWDRAHSLSINPQIKYIKCNETLRSEFYTGKWYYASCDPHTILMSQANTPLKGAHLAIKALPSIIKRYPDAKLLIAGGDPTQSQTFKQKMRIRTYGKYLKALIKKLKIEEHVQFIGYQNAEGMKQYLLKSNVFLSASSIENSPNSLGEAQLLGTPCVASFVGGTPDFIPDSYCGILYRYDDYVMLSDSICKAFETSPNFDNTQMRNLAMARHGAERNISDLLDGYKLIMNE